LVHAARHQTPGNDSDRITVEGRIVPEKMVSQEPHAAASTGPELPKHPGGTRWINACILAGSGMFVFGLLVSAIFAPEWRVLHVLQALIYVAVVGLTRRQNPYGFGAGFGVAVFWNSIGIFLMPFVRDALQALADLVRTGAAPRPDLVLNLVAFGGHVLVIVACLAGFLRGRPGARQWGQFVAGGIAVIAYFAAIVFTVGPPQAVELFRRIFGL
jgi:hypothetical protein